MTVRAVKGGALGLPALHSRPVQLGKEGAIVGDERIMREQSRHGRLVKEGRGRYHSRELLWRWDGFHEDYSANGVRPLSSSLVFSLIGTRDAIGKLLALLFLWAVVRVAVENEDEYDAQFTCSAMFVAADSRGNRKMWHFRGIRYLHPSLEGLRHKLSVAMNHGIDRLKRPSPA